MSQISDKEWRALELARELKKREKYTKLFSVDPYDWQKRLANASAEYSQMMAMCANRVGKTFGGAYITACHVTGRYPDWWEGHKFKEPIYAWAAGVSNDTTRDIVQSELFGESSDPAEFGAGTIPLEDIVEVVKRRGASGNSYDSVIVKHYDPDTGEYNGNSRIAFKSYEMGEEKFYGRSLHWIWLDEQVPDNIYTQCITRTADTAGKVLLTFTPEDGVTATVKQFTTDRKPGQFLIGATWDDAPHLSEEVKTQLLAQYPPAERELRSKGIPVFGRGLVFPVSEERIVCEPFTIPRYWVAIAGLDFGWDHPTAVAWLRYDRDSDTLYVVDEYRESKLIPIVHAAAIKGRAQCPVMWPHDGYQHDKGSGISLADQYRRQGVAMHYEHVTNAPAPGEAAGNNKVEPGLLEMLERMETGRFKVFSTCRQWLEEFRVYHRGDNGKPVALDDDLMSATRYAVMGIRFADVPKDNSPGYGWGSSPQPSTNWIV